MPGGREQESSVKKFRLVVDGIDRKEYLQACHESGRRLYLLLALSMIAICGLIILFSGNASPAAFIGPAVVYIVVVGAYEILTRVTYRDQLAVIDPPVEYDFNGGRWMVTKGDQTVEIQWKETPRLHVTKRCVFLYNDDTTSNLLPRRLMTDEQVQSLETWFRNSRAQAKELQKKQDRLAREQFRQSHPGLRLGRTGPAWGPWKKKR